MAETDTISGPESVLRIGYELLELVANGLTPRLATTIAAEGSGSKIRRKDLGGLRG